MAGSKTPGPVCQVENPVEIDDGTMCLAASPSPGPVCGPDSEPSTDPSSSLVLRAVQGISISLGAQLTWDSIQRQVYNAGAEAIRQQAQELVRSGAMTAEQAKVWSNGQRNALMDAVRDDSSPLGRAIAQAIKPKGKSVADLEALGKSAEGIIESAGKTNSWVNRVAIGFRYAGPAMLVIGIGFSAYRVVEAAPGEGGSVAASEAGTWAGALAGGWGGGEVGAEVGAGACFWLTPAGMAACGAVGAFLGGVGGAVFGGWVGSQAGRYVYRSLQLPAISPEEGRNWHAGNDY